MPPLCCSQPADLSLWTHRDCRNTPEYVYALASGLFNAGLLIWGFMFIEGLERIHEDCYSAIDALGLYPLFWVTMSLQALSLWYWLWCFLFSCIPPLRRISGLTTGQVKLRETKGAVVRMGPRRPKRGSSLAVDPECDDGRGKFVPLEASPGAYE